MSLTDARIWIARLIMPFLPTNNSNFGVLTNPDVQQRRLLLALAAIVLALASSDIFGGENTIGKTLMSRNLGTVCALLGTRRVDRRGWESLAGSAAQKGPNQFQNFYRRPNIYPTAPLPILARNDAHDKETMALLQISMHG